MTPELIAAIKARISAGQDESLIRQSVLEGGYTEEVCSLAYKQATDELASGVVATNIPVAPKTLPSVINLVEESFAFVFARLSLVGLIFVPSVLAYVLTALPEFSFIPESAALVFQVLAIPFYIIYAFNTVAVLYIVATGGSATYKEALVWVKSNFWGMIFMYILLGFAIFGGFLLFLIPGLVVLTTLYFAPYSFTLDGKRGMDALLHSRELVQGKFWPVLYKIVGFGLIMFIPVFLVAFLFGMAEGFGSTELPQVELVGNILLEIFSAFYTVMGFQAMTRVYTALKTYPHETVSSSFTKALYGVLMVIGLVTIPLLIFLVYKYGWDEESFTSMPLEAPIETMVLRGEMTNLSKAATEYQKVNNSFENVCATLMPLLSVTENVECNDSESAWAIAATEGDERWCADTTTEAKLIKTNLDGKTACISLPKQEPAVKIEGSEISSTTENIQE